MDATVSADQVRIECVVDKDSQVHVWRCTSFANGSASSHDVLALSARTFAPGTTITIVEPPYFTPDGDPACPHCQHKLTGTECTACGWKRS